MRDWASPVTCAVMTCATLLAFPAAAVAGDLHMQPGIFSDPEFNPTVTMGAAVSHVTGSAHEYVFRNNGAYTQSRLDWQINDVNMLNASIGVRLTPWVSFQLSGGTKLNGESELDDYDWELKGHDWTQWSNHPQTTITDANRVDVSGNLSLFRHPNFTLDAIGGVRWNQWGFKAFGGHQISTSDINDPAKFRDTALDFPAEPIIGYKQNLITPYLGMQLNVMFDHFAFDAAVAASPFSSAHDYDQHFLGRHTLYQGSFHNGNYVDYKFGGSWKYSEKLTFTGNWEREQYSLTKGSTTGNTINLSGVNGTGTVTTNKNPGNVKEGPAGGFDNSTDRFSIGAVYSLY
jgi:outer membrane protease